MRLKLFIAVALLLAGGAAASAKSEVADAAQHGDKAAVRTLLQAKADVNTPQADGTTGLHWAAQADDLELADLLIRAVGNDSAANGTGVKRMRLASMKGSAAMLHRLLDAGADANAP